MTTPEGKVKRIISKFLISIGPDLWYHMPVLSRFGKRTVDYLACYRGHFFVIEAKRDDEEPTPAQNLEMRAVEAAGGKAFLIRNADELLELKLWLRSIDDAQN